VAAAPGAPAQNGICASAKTTGTGGDNRPPLRSGLRLIGALPGEPAFATVAAAQPLEPSQQLDACMCASGPHDFAVRGQRRTSIGTNPSTAFRTTFVTTRTPLVPVAEPANHTLASDSEKQKYFCAGALTGIPNGCLSGKSVGHLLRSPKATATWAYRWLRGMGPQLEERRRKRVFAHRTSLIAGSPTPQAPSSRHGDRISLQSRCRADPA
jgi:hypothetical protein